ncbi:MAG: hypothetical protein M1837_007232 [Sclerophora amabilis]|nr:MAG: hypothetical protein M1837_007232 [Sclerophora amabilis]
MFFRTNQPRGSLFTEEDVKSLFITTSSATAAAAREADYDDNDGENDEDSLPLLPLRSGAGVLRAREAKRRISRIILAEESAGYAALLRSLYAQTSQSPLSILRFIKENKISEKSFRRIVKESNDLLDAHGAGTQKASALRFSDRDRDCVYSIRYWKRLEDELQAFVKDADRPVQLESASFTGDPPLDLLEDVGAAVAARDAVHGTFRRTHKGFEFVPSVYLSAKRDELLQLFLRGELEWITISDLREVYHVDPGSLASVDDPLNGQVILLKQIAVSRVYIDRQLRTFRDLVKTQGFCAIETSNLGLSKEDSADLHRYLSDRIVDENASSTNRLDFIDNHVVSHDFREKLGQNALDTARAQAQQGWRKGNEPIYRPSVVLNAKALGAESMKPDVFRQVLPGKAKTDAERAFNTELLRLQKETTSSFARYWTDRVMAKFEMYKHGLESVQDAKLREDLSTTLQEYVVDDLIPVTLKRAAAEGLVLGKTINRNVEDLKSSIGELKTEEFSSKELDPLDHALGTFLRALDPDWRATLDLPGRKTQHAQDMLTNMQNDKNDPRLFLTLVLILIARDNPGLVYASGKFAPRLLKQLKGKIDGERFEWLKRIKDQAKSGQISSEDREEMRAFAQASWEKR